VLNLKGNPSRQTDNFEGLLQSVNTDYLAIRRLTQERLQNKYKHSFSTQEFNKMNKVERTMRKLYSQDETGKTFEKETLMYNIYKHKKEDMNIFVKAFL